MVNILLLAATLHFSSALAPPPELLPLPPSLAARFEQALVANHINKPITIGVVKNEVSNAYATSRYIDKNGITTDLIIVNTGLLTELTDDQVFVILGHEVGHIMLSHTKGKSGFLCHMVTNLSRECELAADIYSITFAQRAGTDPCVILPWYEQMIEESGVEYDYTDLTHPSNRERFNNYNSLAHCGRTPYTVTYTPKPVNIGDRELD